jgi:hypothetical protein
MRHYSYVRLTSTYIDYLLSFALRSGLLVLLCGVVVLCGCSGDTGAEHGHSHDPSGASEPRSAESFSLPDGIDASTYVLADGPDGAQNVIAARQSVGDDEDVVIVGRIGGREKPWVEGQAAFSIVDPSLKACSDIPGDNCPMPWDYCCETDKLPSSTAFVKVVDEKGDVVKADARALLGVKELSTVVVKGKAERDDAGNLTVLASGVYVSEESRDESEESRDESEESRDESEESRDESEESRDGSLE